MSGKKLQYLVLHCTATPEGREVYPDQVRMWHTDPLPLADGRFQYMGKVYESVDALPKEVQAKNRRGRGWKQVGYSDMIFINQGLFINMVPYNEDNIVDAWELTNGATGINSISRHIVYVGGCDKQMNTKDTRTPEQRATMTQYVRNFIKRYPDIKVAGHNQFAQKACPSFDVPSWLQSIGVDEKNIYRP